MTGDRQVYHTGSNEFGITVEHYGDAEGTKDAFSKSHPEAINGVIQENYSAYSFATGTIAPTLDGIKADLAACWDGSSAADEAMGIIATMAQDAQTIGTNTKACGEALAQFQSDWIRLKGEASGLDQGILGSGIDADDSGAHKVFQQFTQSMQTSMHSMPSELYYHTSLNNPNSNIPGPASPGPVGPGPGPGPLGPGPGPGPIAPGPGPHPINPPHVPGPVPPVPGPGPVGPGPVGPGGIGPGGIGPGGGYGPGAAIDTGSQLAGFDGGAGGGSLGGGGLGGGGLDAGGLGGGGLGGGGLGAGGLGSSTAGLGGGGAGAGGIGAAGGVAGGGAGAGGRGVGMMPMQGGGGQGGNGQDRERTTWLAEDEDVWGGDDAPPGVIA